MSNKQFSITSNFNIKTIKEGDGDSIVIEGYANTTSADRDNDIILEEAWNKGGLSNFSLNPILLAFHDHTKPIGIVKEYSADSGGLKVVAEVFKAAGNIYEFIKDGVLRTFSVGFRVKDADYDSSTDLFLIKDLELYEISVVSIPANAGSVFSVRKAFEDDSEYTKFREEFTMTEKVKEVKEEVEEVVKAPETTSADIMKALEARLEKQSNDFTAAFELLLEKKMEKENMTEKVKPAPVVQTNDRVEELMKAFEARMAEKEKSMSEALEGLRGDLAEKAAELEALQRNKMSFQDNKPTRANDRDVDSAILLSKAMGRRVEDTKFGKNLIEKAGVSPHLGSTTETWEEEFSMRLESDIRENLIMEPMFRTIAMNTVSMHIPINPETSYGEWIARTYPPLRSADGASTGTAVDHEIVDTTLTAHKLVSKEYLGDEEEEDSILPLMPIVRDAVMRRMAKAADRALLRGDAAQATGDGDTYPFNGIYTVGLDAGNNTTNPVATPISVAMLQTVRRDLGVWGLNPNDLIYIVSQDAYYDLLEDTDFRTMDLVGDRATILRGQIGAVNGSPVVVSGEFAAKGVGAGAVVCLNKANFIVGNLRNVRVETDRSVEDQKNIIVASRRMGFLDLISGKGSSVLTWAA